MAFAFALGGPNDPITAPARNPPVRRLSLPLVVAFALHLAAAVPALAVDTDWTGAVSGDWSQAGNWSAGAPTAVDSAFLPSPAASNPTITLPAAAVANRLTVTGSGYSLTTGSLALADNFYVDGSSALLSLSSGARVTSPNATIGISGGNAGNRLLVDSRLGVAGTLNVGYDGTGNRLDVLAGGSVSGANVWLGGLASSASNIAQVASTGTLSAPGTLVVGYGGDDNSIGVSGRVAAAATTLGLEAGADRNTATVSGGGLWTNAGGLTVGASSTANAFAIFGTLQVTGGANDVVVGDAVAAAGNGVTVFGGTFSSQAAFVVGKSSSRNTFYATDGATVTSNNVRIGLNAGSVDNTANADGAGTTWTINGKLRVGSDGNDNRLTVTNGAVVTVASDVFVGGTSTSGTAGGNSITVTGSGSTLAILSGTADLVIGYGTGTNEVTVADGGALALSSIRMGPNGTLAIGQGGKPGTVSPAATIDGFTGGKVVFSHTSSGYTFANPLSGGLQVQQFPAGRTVLSGSNSYTGSTLVQSGGTLALSAAANNIAASTDVAVYGVLDVTGVTGGFVLASGQTLRGNGGVLGGVTTGTGSIVQPQGSGTLAFGSTLTQAGGLEIFLSGSQSGGIGVTSALTLDPTSAVTFTVGDPLTAPAYVFGSYGSLAGTFGSVTGLPAGYVIDYNYLGGNRMALVAVPEPGTVALALAGLAISAVAVRRRRR